MPCAPCNLFKHPALKSNAACGYHTAFPIQVFLDLCSLVAHLGGYAGVGAERPGLFMADIAHGQPDQQPAAGCGLCAGEQYPAILPAATGTLLVSAGIEPRTERRLVTG